MFKRSKKYDTQNFEQIFLEGRSTGYQPLLSSLYLHCQPLLSFLYLHCPCVDVQISITFSLPPISDCECWFRVRFLVLFLPLVTLCLMFFKAKNDFFGGRGVQDTPLHIEFPLSTLSMCQSSELVNFQHSPNSWL